MKNKIVSLKEPYLIAEAGINHNGDLNIAKRLIDAAFTCKWDCVKFQKRDPDTCIPEKQKKIIRQTPWGRMTYLEYRQKVEFGKEEYSFVDRYCKKKSLDWTASVWDIPSLNFILQFDVPFIKIPSAKITEKKLIREVAKSSKTILLSTGMSTVKEIDEAVKILNKYNKGNYILMHSNSTYPTPRNEINMSVIEFLRGRYKCPVGYSGHEYDLEPSVIAFTLGAKIIERHITLDRKMWGSDHSASLELAEMKTLRRRIQDADKILGNGIKKITRGEVKARKVLRGY